MSHHRSIYMPSSTSAPKVKREGFDVPLSSPSSGLTGGPSARTDDHRSSIGGIDNDDGIWANSLNLGSPNSNSNNNNSSSTSSSFAHLHKYTSPSSTSYNHSYPTASLDFHDTLSSLVNGTAFNEGNKSNSSNSNGNGSSGDGERGRSTFSHFGAYSAPIPSGGNANGFSFNTTTNQPSAVPTSSSRNPSAGDVSGLHHHLLNHSLESSGSPHSSNTTFSHQSTFSFFDPAGTNGYQSLGGGGYHGLGNTSASPLSPATSVSLSTTAGFPSAPPSSIRSRSRSSVRTGGGKALSSRSRASRKGEGATSPPPPGFNGSLGSVSGSIASHGRRASTTGVAPSPSSLSSGGLGLLAMPASGQASSMPAHLLQQNSDASVGASAGGGSPAHGTPAWFFSPSSTTDGGRELPLVEGKESVFGEPSSYSPEMKALDLVEDGLHHADGKHAEDGEPEDEDAAAKAAEKRRRRRESHNAVERRRRDVINEKISELATLLPTCLLDPKATTISSLNQLGSELGVEMLTAVGEEDEEESEPEEEPVSKKKGAKKGEKGVPPKKKGKSGGAGGSNAIGPDGKPNKGIVLKKSVDYIRYLHQIIQAQSNRTAQLESALTNLLSQTQSQQSSRPTSDGASASTSSQHSSPPDMFAQSTYQPQQQYIQDPLTNQLIAVNPSGSSTHHQNGLYNPHQNQHPQQTYSYSTVSDSPGGDHFSPFQSILPSSSDVSNNHSSSNIPGIGNNGPVPMQQSGETPTSSHGGGGGGGEDSPSMMFQSWTAASDSSPVIEDPPEQRGRARERWGGSGSGSTGNGVKHGGGSGSRGPSAPAALVWGELMAHRHRSESRENQNGGGGGEAMEE